MTIQPNKSPPTTELTTQSPEISAQDDATISTNATFVTPTPDTETPETVSFAPGPQTNEMGPGIRQAVIENPEAEGHPTLEASPVHSIIGHKHMVPPPSVSGITQPLEPANVGEILKLIN